MSFQAMSAANVRLLAAADELGLSGVVEPVPVAASNEVVRRIASEARTRGRRPKHASLDGVGVDGAISLPAEPYEPVIGSLIEEYPGAYWVANSDLFGGEGDLALIILHEVRFATVLSWWSGVSNYYWFGMDSDFALSVNPYVIQIAGVGPALGSLLTELGGSQ